MPSYHVQDRDQRPSGDESASSMDENGYNVNDDLVSDQDLPDTTSYDPFVPVERVPAKPIVNIVTLRAIVLGSLCGSLVNASNIYLGLKVGWTSSANILGVSLFLFATSSVLSCQTVSILSLLDKMCLQ